VPDFRDRSSLFIDSASYFRRMEKVWISATPIPSVIGLAGINSSSL
jgi:hypothetical protein